jgi:hypothetical protein
MTEPDFQTNREIAQKAEQACKSRITILKFTGDYLNKQRRHAVTHAT